jgi:hypothetical protein
VQQARYPNGSLCDGLLGIGQAFRILALQMICPGAVVIGSVIWCERHLLGEIGYCQVVETLFYVGTAATVVQVCGIWSECDRLGVIRNGLIVEALLPMGEAEAVKGLGQIRAELDRLLEIFNGAIVLTFSVAGDTAISEPVVWTEPDRLVVVRDGAVVLTFFAVGVAAIGLGGSNIFRRLLTRANKSRAASDPEVGIFTGAPRRILASGLRPCGQCCER